VPSFGAVATEHGVLTRSGREQRVAADNPQLTDSPLLNEARVLAAAADAYAARCRFDASGPTVEFLLG
jgi:hypothetical protein